MSISSRKQEDIEVPKSQHDPSFALTLCHRLIARSPSAMAAVSGENHIVYDVNPAFCSLFGLKKENLIGYPFAEAMPVQGGGCKSVLDRVYRTGEAENIIVEEHSAPSPLYFSYMAWAIPDADERPVGLMIQATDKTEELLSNQRMTEMNQELLLGSIRQHEFTIAAEEMNARLETEITERKLVEEELRKSRDLLEDRVKERTSEINDMYQMQKIITKMLEQSNRDLEDFAHVVSHDLQEPLRKIQTFGDRMITKFEASLSEEAMEGILKIRQAAGRMLALILDLLKYSRMTSEPPVFSRLNLGKVVTDVVSDLTVLFDEKKGKIEISELPEIDADRVQMHQLFQNLITNSLKYRGEQNPLIRIFSTAASNGFCEIHVEDNGIGFDERYLDKIFKPFQRLHGKSSPYEGTGLGLAICRKVVERLGGSITASSEPGKGSTFTVKLPKCPASSEDRT